MLETATRILKIKDISKPVKILQDFVPPSLWTVTEKTCKVTQTWLQPHAEVNVELDAHQHPAFPTAPSCKMGFGSYLTISATVSKRFYLGKGREGGKEQRALLRAGINLSNSFEIGRPTEIHSDSFLVFFWCPLI